SARRKLGELSMSCRKGSTGTVNAVVPSAFSSTTSTAMIFVGMLVVWPVSGSLPIMTKGKLLVPPAPLGPINDPLKFATETTLGTAPGGSTVMLEEAAVSSFRKSVGLWMSWTGIAASGPEETESGAASAGWAVCAFTVCRNPNIANTASSTRALRLRKLPRERRRLAFIHSLLGGKIEPKWLGRMRGNLGVCAMFPEPQRSLRFAANVCHQPFVLNTM